ncbi:rho guanine nucleotide exchange factor 39 [Anolis carolinensis]|uniref:rho guanine nucleotide exchange factor 39 n=1 Tax=Anolis carolinensis TaxID=28377 RepID=UPI002F2B2159
MRRGGQVVGVSSVTAGSAMGGDPVREQRGRWARGRVRAEAALRAGEEAYLGQVQAVAQYFVALLKAKGTLEPDAREAIFGRWGALCGISRALLSHLERGLLGPGLEAFCAQIGVFLHYAEDLPRARETLERQVRKNKAFSRFKRLQETRPEFGGSRLEDLLLLPLQRLRQYKPLLLDLVENTPLEIPDAEQLRAALKSVAEAVHQIQEIARFHENVDHLSRIQKLLKGRKTQVMQPGRWFLQEGWLMVAPPKGEGLRPRMFFLFSDVLLMARPCHPLHPWNAHKVAVKEVLWLQPQCSVAKVFGHSRGHGGLLSLSFPHKTLLLVSFDQEDLDTWHRNLTAAIRKLQTSISQGH